MVEGFLVYWKNCEVHCWCAYDEEDYPQWAKIIAGMKIVERDHGDSTTCTGCMIADGRMTLVVDSGKGYSIGMEVERTFFEGVPPPWKEGDPAPLDATYLFDDLSKG